VKTLFSFFHAFTLFQFGFKCDSAKQYTPAVVLHLMVQAMAKMGLAYPIAFWNGQEEQEKEQLESGELFTYGSPLKNKKQKEGK
jgi:hypothetical protein